jgi:hypothetical protein
VMLTSWDDFVDNVHRIIVMFGFEHLWYSVENMFQFCTEFCVF